LRVGGVGLMVRLMRGCRLWVEGLGFGVLG